MSQGTEGVEHADYEGLAPYPDCMFDPDTRAYSAVLPLAAPASGVHLRIWKDRCTANEQPAYADDTLQIVPYSVVAW